MHLRRCRLLLTPSHWPRWRPLGSWWWQQQVATVAGVAEGESATPVETNCGESVPVSSLGVSSGGVSSGVGGGIILGIETSCDDTGCAVISAADGRILAHRVSSQHGVHVPHGGVIPAMARELHSQCIERLVAETLQEAGLAAGGDGGGGGGLVGVDAVAVTVQPGLSLSLMVGVMYAKYLCSGGAVWPVNSNNNNNGVGPSETAAAAAGSEVPGDSVHSGVVDSAGAADNTPFRTSDGATGAAAAFGGAVGGSGAPTTAAAVGGSGAPTTAAGGGGGAGSVSAIDDSGRCSRLRIPLIPVHHMEAHALAARLRPGRLQFPYLALLISGGHAQLALVAGADDFRLLGTALDNAPGQILDKVARRLRLHHHIHHLQQHHQHQRDSTEAGAAAAAGAAGGKECRRPISRCTSGAQALEQLARYGKVGQMPDQPLSRSADCNFSFSGLLTWALQLVEAEERRLDCGPSQLLPTAADVCATVQHTVAVHLCRRTQRAFEYCQARQLLQPPPPLTEPSGGGSGGATADWLPTLVVAGGVARNSYIGACLRRVCHVYGVRLVVPPPWLCTDNGAMVAWNGVEKWRLYHHRHQHKQQQQGQQQQQQQQGQCGGDSLLVYDADRVQFAPRAPLGVDISRDVARCGVKCRWVKLDPELMAASCVYDDNDDVGDDVNEDNVRQKE